MSQKAYNFIIINNNNNETEYLIKSYGTFQTVPISQNDINNRNGKQIINVNYKIDIG